VSVSIASQTGAALPETVVVFDPLEVSPASTHASASIDQVDKQFVPHVSVVRTGTEVSFPNSDHVRHQVYSFSPAKTFNLKLYAGASAAPVKFDKAGLVVLGCNIHDKMLGFVAVVESPYFAKSDAQGNLVLELPAGRYRLRVWHPNLTSPVAPREITVGSTPLNLPLNVTSSSAPAQVAAWPE
jgi:plastocyanin